MPEGEGRALVRRGSAWRTPSSRWSSSSAGGTPVTAASRSRSTCGPTTAAVRNVAAAGPARAHRSSTACRMLGGQFVGRGCAELGEEERVATAARVQLVHPVLADDAGGIGAGERAEFDGLVRGQRQSLLGPLRGDVDDPRGGKPRRYLSQPGQRSPGPPGARRR